MDNIIAPLKIEDFRGGAGNRSKFERKLKVSCSALSPQYPVDNISLPKEVHDGAIERGKEYICELTPTGLKDSDKDPEKTWSYWWEIIRWDIKDSASPPPTAGATTPFDSNSSQRYTQYCTNARTALMQAIQVHMVDGAYIQTEMTPTFAIADEILGWLNNVTFTSSPNSGHLAVDAVNNGAVPTDIKDAGAILNGWKIPDSIENGIELKKACQDNHLEADWVMGTAYKSLNIAKSSDYTNAERGSYRDLFMEILKIRDDEIKADEIKKTSEELW